MEDGGEGTTSAGGGSVSGSGTTSVGSSAGGGGGGAGGGSAGGGWVLLQNCELGLGLMGELEQILGGLAPAMEVNPGFRLFLTAMPTPEFPLSLLQMSMQ